MELTATVQTDLPEVASGGVVAAVSTETLTAVATKERDPVEAVGIEMASLTEVVVDGPQEVHGKGRTLADPGAIATTKARTISTFGSCLLVCAAFVLTFLLFSTVCFV